MRASLTAVRASLTAVRASLIAVRASLIAVRLAALLAAVLAVSPSAAEEPRDAIRALCERLGIGPGAVVADVGCGEGRDTFGFAGIVGERGTVLAEEIDAGKLKQILDGSNSRGLRQVVPILGESDDPRLPDGLADLVYMHIVFHHFSNPRGMLRNFWRDLEPGGRLVIVDQSRGPLADWTPLERRQSEHHWTGETTVVRLAREEGFEFVEAPDDLGFPRDQFVLVFRRPLEAEEPRGDPDRAQPLDAAKVVDSLPALADGAVVLVALDGGRALLPALRHRGRHVHDIVLEEWATSKDELPEVLPAEGVEVSRTDKGELRLAEGASVGLVVFADSYHRIWEPTRILGALRDRMGPGARLVVVDRRGPDGEPRRLVGHRRRISPSLVREELEGAGFEFAGEAPSPSPDRFLLIFAPGPKQRLF